MDKNKRIRLSLFHEFLRHTYFSYYFITICILVFLVTSTMVFHPKQEGPTVSFNAATTLHNFCVWQQSQNVQDDSHPTHHDTALLITRYTLISHPHFESKAKLLKKSEKWLTHCMFICFREDICRAKDKCDTLGKLLPFSFAKICPPQVPFN